jgi:hypothetical protein
MAIPEYIIKAANEYSKGDVKLFNAFIAGHKATRQPQTKHIALNDEQEKMFEQCWVLYGRKGNKAQAKREWVKIPPSSIPLVLSHIKAYIGSREKKYQKDFERYLRDRIFETIVMDGNRVVYDPEQFSNATEYRPATDGVFQFWNESRKCLMFNGYIDQLNDGYTNDNRPDGAKVAWSMYTWVWSSERKEWVKQE